MTGQVFLPEPCPQCDNGLPCDTHDTRPTWGDDWLHPSERKHAPTTKEWKN